jgi:alpha-ribazole phosphatase
MNAALIRHTRVAGMGGRCYGRWEAPLAATFAAEAAAVRRRLPWVPLIVWTSPAERCRRLATRLAGGAPVRVDERLRELDFGVWEGRRWTEFRGPDSEAWALDPWRLRPPGGESGEEFLIRVAAVRGEWLERPLPRLAIVTHAGVVRLWRALATGTPPARMWADPVACGSVHAAE